VRFRAHGRGAQRGETGALGTTAELGEPSRQLLALQHNRQRLLPIQHGLFVMQDVNPRVFVVGRKGFEPPGGPALPHQIRPSIQREPTSRRKRCAPLQLGGSSQRGTPTRHGRRAA